MRASASHNHPTLAAQKSSGAASGTSGMAGHEGMDMGGGGMDMGGIDGATIENLHVAR